MSNRKQTSLNSLLFISMLFVVFSQDDRLLAEETMSNTTTHAFDQSIYITMSDGVRIAVDIALPLEVQKGGKVPTMIRATRYWRATEIKQPQARYPLIEGVTQMGYAVVSIDVRGTGASFGSRSNEFSIVETKDLFQIIDWISKQSWSNGSVASIGVSYEGNTAENVGFGEIKALKATIPMFTDFDLFTSILFPGGLPNKLIIDQWGHSTGLLDKNDNAGNLDVIGVKPVDSDTDHKLLIQAVADHQHNKGVTEIFSNVTYRDDINWANSLESKGNLMISPHLFKKAAEKQQVPSFHWGSWMDASTAAGIIARFASYETAGRYVIGAWNHGADMSADPFLSSDVAVEPSVMEQYSAIFNFLGLLMNGKGREIDSQPSEKVLYYYTMGQSRWKQTNIWPPKGSSKMCLYLAKDNKLENQRPIEAKGNTEYTVNFGHGTGATSRWTTQLGSRKVDYGDRRGSEAMLLNFTSAPFVEDMEITGHPVIHLEMSSSTNDGAVIVYLQDVAPDGTVRMITEGQLRLIHRKRSTDEPPYPVFGQYHSFLQKDMDEVTADEITTVSFALLPTSVLIKKDHSVRIAIAGHDKDVFARIPETGKPVYRVEHNSKSISYLELPIISSETEVGTKKLLDLLQ